MEKRRKRKRVSESSEKETIKLLPVFDHKTIESAFLALGGKLGEKKRKHEERQGKKESLRKQPRRDIKLSTVILCKDKPEGGSCKKCV